MSVSIFWTALLLGCASRRAIHGQVLDRNGAPVDRVIVTLAPGNIELVTDSEGRFVIDYLRDDDGDRVKLSARQDYTLEAFRVGYHVSDVAFHYARGAHALEPLTLTEETIRVSPSEADIDPDRYPDRTHSSGSAYEGE
jgi:hypothetical protein